MADDDKKDTSPGEENQSEGNIFDQLTSLQDVGDQDLPEFEGEAGSSGEDAISPEAPNTPSLADFRRGGETDVNTRKIANRRRAEEEESDTDETEDDGRGGGIGGELNLGSLSLGQPGNVFVEGLGGSDGDLPDVPGAAGGGDEGGGRTNAAGPGNGPGGARSQGSQGEPQAQPAQPAAPAFPADVVRFSGDMVPSTPRDNAAGPQRDNPSSQQPNPPEAPPATPGRPTGSVTLWADTVAEGSTITILARVDAAPLTDLVLTLSNGQTITIEARETSGSVTFANPNTEDALVDAGTLSFSVTGTTGGNYRALDTSGATVSVAVSDTETTSSVTLSADPVSEGSAITITANVDNAPGTDLVLTLSNGQTITIAAGQTSGSVTFANPNTEDGLVDAGTLSFSVTSTSGGNYEALDTSGASVSVVVSDTIDTVTVSITADGDVSEAEAASFTVSVSQALADDLVVTLSNGETVTIAAGATSASYSVAAQGDDVYVDGSEVVL
ncbi:immunoglobulin-like domain-containing protein, partial [Roseicyclus marinus]|uniref:immunoglobulin-like domain-containing protein n=1 Tax=Roseicyclus marinus TaxID=2161673 RepID=UPI0024E136C6